MPPILIGRESFAGISNSSIVFLLAPVIRTTNGVALDHHREDLGSAFGGQPVHEAHIHPLCLETQAKGVKLDAYLIKSPSHLYKCASNLTALEPQNGAAINPTGRYCDQTI